MIKKILLGLGLAAVTIVLVYGAILRTAEKTGDEASSPQALALNGQGGQGVQGGRGGGWGNESGETHESEPRSEDHGELPAEEMHQPLDLSGVKVGELSQAEIDGLVFMREEEKLARDVYLAMYDLWAQRTFTNIARSEQEHMDSVLELLDAYGIADPVAGKEQGEFQNAELQALYDDLIAQGSQSLAEALRVGAAIEEIDILDLRERQAQTTDSHILRTYANLESGSENHLRAFVSVMGARKIGVVYQPQYLSEADYQAIIGAANQGQGNRGNR